jgi:outer membrane usher protein
VVDFGVRSASNAAIVILHGADGKPLRAGLSGALQPGLRGTAATPEFVVGYDGRAFVENLGPGNDIVVQLDKGECRAHFSFEPRQATQVTLGPVSCR